MKALLIAIMMAAAAVVSAQQAGQTLKVDVELVQIYATVTDDQGRYVKDLKRESFQVFEDGVAQKIEAFSADDVPVSAGILLDVGGTMKANLPVAKEGALTFLNSGHLDNEYFLIEFNDHAELTEDYNNDPGKLRSHITFLPANRNKAVYDAVSLGLEKLKDAYNPKKMLLLLSSGGALTGENKPAALRTLARRMDAQIFGVDLPAEVDLHGDIDTGTRSTDEIVASLGGQNFVSSSAPDYLNICRRIAVAVRNQYAIAYHSTNPAHDGKYRRIRVELDPPRGAPPLFVQAREGYYAAIEP